MAYIVCSWKEYWITACIRKYKSFLILNRRKYIFVNYMSTSIVRKIDDSLELQNFF